MSKLYVVKLAREEREPKKLDYVYTRHGMCVLWMFVEPLAGWRAVRVTERKTAVDWAHQVPALVDDPRYGNAKRIVLVCDQLNTHTLASLYAAFEPSSTAGSQTATGPQSEARQLAQ